MDNALLVDVIRKLKSRCFAVCKEEDEAAGGDTKDMNATKSAGGLRFCCHLCTFVIRADSPSALVAHLRQQHHQSAASLLTTPRIKSSFD